jgi:hypothetical protein
MRKGYGKTQRAIANLIKTEPDGAWAYDNARNLKPEEDL